VDFLLRNHSNANLYCRNGRSRYPAPTSTCFWDIGLRLALARLASKYTTHPKLTLPRTLTFTRHHRRSI
jgi:hypothetical protein